jgi:spore coat protein U-like protein
MTRLPNSRVALSGLGLAALLLAAAPVQAATTTTTFAVTATVNAACLVTAGPLTFGLYTGVADLAGTTTVNTRCTVGTAYTVGLDAGTSAGSTPSARKMTGPGGAFLNYSLSQDAAHSVNWGNSPPTDTPPSATGDGTLKSLTVFGLVPASQFVATGAYTDTITVTVTF